jgi:phosphopantothenoylcysteine decarboxylase/phosphopantothenate--cysteine ligase
MHVSGREVILGVGGGIAAYKSCDLLRRLLDNNFHVTVVPTPSSLNFVGKATWEALSGRAVTTEVFENVNEVRHISLAKNSDYIIIAPATADLLARLAMGRADDLLTNVFLASKAPKMIVPAMHPQMWKNEATVANVATLRARGITVLDPDTGALTSGDVGQGRFPETQRIISEFESITSRAKDFLGKRVLVTAGGTREPIDPVRFIGNNSSGKQGYAIARSALNRGGEVTLIAANSALADIDGVRMIKVGTAAEMHAAVVSEFPQCDVLVMSAAVADAKPMHQGDSKIKKSDFTSIELTENEKIERKDYTKLCGWREALNVKIKGLNKKIYCYDSVKNLLDINLPGWRLEFDRLKRAEEIVKRANERVKNGGLLLPRAIYELKNRNTPQLE